MTLQLAWALLAPLALGAAFLRICRVRLRDDPLSWFAWAWPCGCFLLAASLWIAVVLSVPASAWFVVPMPALAALWFAARRAVDVEASPAAPRIGWPLRIALAFVVVLFCAHFAKASGLPCLLGDEANLWATKAKSLLLDWPRGEFAAAQQFTPHPDYPLLNPLLQAWIYAACDGVVHFESRWLVMLCGLCVPLAVAAGVRRCAGDGWAAAAALAIALEPEWLHMTTAAYADGMVGLGLVIGLDAWLREHDTPRRAHRAMAAMGCAFALWSKNEALLYLAIACAAFAAAVVIRRRALPRVDARMAWIALPLALFACQFAWNRWFGLSNDLFGKGGKGGSVPELFMAQFADRMIPVLDAMASALCDPKRLHFALALPFLALLFLRRAALSRALFAPTLMLVGAVVVLHLIYVGSYLVLSFHLATSQLRVLFQLVPAALVWTAATARVVREGGR